MKHKTSLIVRIAAAYLVCLAAVSCASAQDRADVFQRITSGRVQSVPSKMVMIDGELMMRIPQDWVQIEWEETELCVVSQEADATSMIAVFAEDAQEFPYAGLTAMVSDVSDISCRAMTSDMEWVAGYAQQGIILVCEGRNAKNYIIYFDHESSQEGMSDVAIAGFSMAIRSLRRADDDDRRLAEGKLEDQETMQEPVAFEDAQFEAMLRKAMGRSADEAIYASELERVKKLYITEDGMDFYDWQQIPDTAYEQQSVLSLIDLKKFSNLTTLYICDMQIAGLENLESCPQLESLSLIGCDVESCEPFRNLTGLTNLSLARNSLREIDALAGLVNLEYLNLYMNEVSDISAVAGMTQLKGLLLTGTRVASLEPVRGLTKLEWIKASNVAGHTLSLEPLGGLTALESVEFESTATCGREYIAHVENVKLSKPY